MTSPPKQYPLEGVDPQLDVKFKEALRPVSVAENSINQYALRAAEEERRQPAGIMIPFMNVKKGNHCS